MNLSKITSSIDKLTTIQGNDKLFACPLKKTLIHQVVNSYFYNSHIGTKAQKSRSEVRGGGRKPWRQKGMGRARAGSIRSPVWRAGGVTFAAKPLKRQQKINRKMFNGALASISSQLVREDRLLITDAIELKQPKTKEMAVWMREKKLTGNSVLFVFKDLDENFSLSIRNIPNVDACDVRHINLLQLMSFDYILLFDSALNFLQERFV
jgi:large subunit ribosomal protein L4